MHLSLFLLFLFFIFGLDLISKQWRYCFVINCKFSEIFTLSYVFKVKIPFLRSQPCKNHCLTGEIGPRQEHVVEAKSPDIFFFLFFYSSE